MGTDGKKMRGIGKKEELLFSLHLFLMQKEETAQLNKGTPVEIEQEYKSKQAWNQ